MKHFVNFVDGGRAEIKEDGKWDFTFPSGKHLRGQEENVEAAEAAVNAEHDKYVLQRWEQGHPTAKKNFSCPLS